MRFHVPGIAHTISTPEYSSCAFTQKVVKLCKMLRMEGHEVIHYGHEDSNVACSEHVTVTTRQDLERAYPGHDWRSKGFPHFARTDYAHVVFNTIAEGELRKRQQPGDFLLCSFGDWHKPLADAVPGFIVVESGIGYPNGTFAPFKVYEFNAIRSAYQGNRAALTASNDFWYDAVIPNAFNLEEFSFSPNVGNYLLFLGRVNDGKGFHIAKQIAKETRTELRVAGPGAQDLPKEKWVTPVGLVSPETRRTLLMGARATICASTYLEPFCGVQIESMLSGTPVISTDWGALAEYNRHGITGYRCKTFEQFTWAARNVHTLNRHACRRYSELFSLERIAPMYTDYFRSVHDVHAGKGWYEKRPERTTLWSASFDGLDRA